MRIVPLSLFPAFIHLCIAPASAQVLPLPHDIGSTLSGFFESVKDTIIPPQQPETFQEEVLNLDPQAGDIVLNEIAKVHEGAAHFAIDLKDAAEQVIRHSKETATQLEEVIGKNGITMTELARRLEEAISGIDFGLEEKEDHQLPECDVGARAQLVAQVLDIVQPIYVSVLTEAGVPPEQAEEQYEGFAAKIKALFLVIGKFICKYPILSDIVIFAVSMLLIPEIPIFRVILRLLGFGLKGPVGGTFAAWLQRRFWGGAVARGSWFAILQKAGMKFTGKWFEKLVTSAGFAAFFGYARGRGEEL